MAIIKVNPAGDAKANTDALIKARAVEEAKKPLIAYDATGPASLGGSSSRGQSSLYSSPNQNNLINSQYDQSLKAKVAALQKARDTAVSGYNQNISALPGEYQPLRNQADLRGEQNSRAINETMAAQGNWRSGANQTAQTANRASTANTIGGFDKQQQDAVDRLRQAIAQVNAGYESDVAMSTADTESQRLAALISQANQDRSFNQQDRQFDMNYGLQRDQFGLAQQGQMQDQAYRVEALQLQKQAQTWQQQFQERGFTADEAYRAAQLKLQQEQQALDEKYRYSALARSGSGGGSSSKGPTTYDKGIAKNSIMSTLNTMANNGASRTELINEVWSNSDGISAAGNDVKEILDWVGKTFTWDKNENGWWDTSAKNAKPPAQEVEKVDRWWNPFD